MKRVYLSTAAPRMLLVALTLYWLALPNLTARVLLAAKIAASGLTVNTVHSSIGKFITRKAGPSNFQMYSPTRGSACWAPLGTFR